MENILRRSLIAAVLVLLALVSALLIAGWASAPETHAETAASIDRKVDTVMKLTASSALASAGISTLPGDAATPIADKLADFTEYFMLILCVLYAEKYLTGIIGAGLFKILIPCACALLIVGLFWKPQLMRRLALKLAVLGLLIYTVIPMSIRVSDLIYDSFRSSIDYTISSTEDFTLKTDELAEAEGDSGLISSILGRISETAGSLTAKAADILNRYVETLAVLIVTTCIIPILVLLFFLWLIKQLSGIDFSGGLPNPLRRGAGGTPQNP